MTDDKRKRRSGNGNAIQAQSGELRAARLGAIKRDIVNNLRQNALSIHATASRHGVSVRYIHQLFAADGTSFSKFVLQQRLAAVHLMLRDARFFGRAVTAIAFEVGFDDVSSFDRAFRRRYGATPSDVRETARQRNGE
jgi:AraC-like DNA-binding protein